MTGRAYLAAVLLLALFGATAVTAQAGSPHRYTPRHGKHCRKGYRMVRRGHGKHRKRFCVKHRTSPRTKDGVRLHAHLDPTYTRDPANPFHVVFAYSASATQEAAAATASEETPAPLPSGVLSFFSDGKLECAINVGGNATGGDCPVIYQQLGIHTVTVIYTSGEESATETENENIEPFTRSITLTDEYSAGVLTIRASASPPGPVRLECRGGEVNCVPIGPLNPADISDGVVEVPVEAGWGATAEEKTRGKELENGTEFDPEERNAYEESVSENGEEVAIFGPTREAVGALWLNEAPSWWPYSAVEGGELYIRAVSESAGYTTTEAKAVVQFVGPHLQP